MRKISQSKKGNITGIIAFAAVVIILLILAPFLLKIVLTPAQKITESLDSMDSGNKSAEATNYLGSVFSGTLDWMIVAFFFINVIILLVTAFLVDVHPGFFIVYLIAVFCLILFAPNFVTFADRLYNDASFTTLPDGTDLTSNIPITSWIYNNFGVVIIGVLILSGLIMFGKFRFGGGNSFQ